MNISSYEWNISNFIFSFLIFNIYFANILYLMLLPSIRYAWLLKKEKTYQIFYIII